MRKAVLACLLGSLAIAGAKATIPGNWVSWRNATGAFTASGGGRHPNMAVCRGSFDNGQHPGKLWDGTCNIGWGGRTIYISNYQLLVGRYRWITATLNGLPANAVDGGDAGNAVGHERLGVCQVFNGGDGSWHPGKFFRNRCYYAWGGSKNNTLGKELRAIPNGNVEILVAD